jgi:hypothetical protein
MRKVEVVKFENNVVVLKTVPWSKNEYIDNEIYRIPYKFITNIISTEYTIHIHTATDVYYIWHDKELADNIRLDNYHKRIYNGSYFPLRIFKQDRWNKLSRYRIAKTLDKLVEKVNL